MVKPLYVLNKEQAEFVRDLCKSGATWRATSNACRESLLFAEMRDRIMEDGSYDGCHLQYGADDYFGVERGTHGDISEDYWKRAIAAKKKVDRP